MKEISSEQIESIKNYLLSSTLPSRDVQQIVGILLVLSPVKEAKPEEKK